MRPNSSVHIICTVTNDLHQDQRMHRICSSLSTAGYRVTLVGRRKHSSRTLPEGLSYRLHRLPMWFQSGKLFYLEYNLRLFAWLATQRGPIIINSVDLDSLLAGFLVGRLKAWPVVFDAHEYFTEVPEVRKRPLTKAIWSGLANWIVPKLRYCYTVSESLAEELSKRYGIPFGLVRNLPRRRVMPPSVDPSEKIILYQGMLNAGRGLEPLIRAMQQLPECTLWLVGNGDCVEDLKALTQSLHLQKRVIFHGFVDPKNLPEYTNRAWLGANLLRLDARSYYFSLANKALDYIQAGLPSLQMRAPEYERLHNRYGVYVLVEDLSPEAIVNAVRQLLEDDARYEQLRAQCQRAAHELIWEREEAQLLTIYLQIATEAFGK